MDEIIQGYRTTERLKNFEYMYFLYQGECDVIKKTREKNLFGRIVQQEEVVLNILPGEFFLEQPMFGQFPGFSVIVRSDTCRCLKIRYVDFKAKFAALMPEVKKISEKRQHQIREIMNSITQNKQSYDPQRKIT